MPTQTIKSDDFFGNPPSWIIRWGITLFTGVFCIFLIFAYFIRYPDFVEKDVIITAKQSPQRLKAAFTGEYSMQVQEGQHIKVGEILGYVETTTKIGDVWQLEGKIKNPYSDTLFLPDLWLGELQGSYELFRLAHLAYKQNKNSSVYVQIKGLEEQVESLSKISENLRNQDKLLQEDLKVQEKAHQRDRELHEKKVISTVELEKSYQNYLSVKRSAETIKSQILQQESAVRESQNRAEELRIANKEKDMKVLADLQAASQKLRSDIEAYKKKYCLIALQEGKVSFLFKQPVQNKIQANEGEEMLAIVTDTKSNLIGSVLVEIENSGKIGIGQTVQVRLFNYPYEEFGMLIGEVKHITSIPTHVQHKNQDEKGKYRVEISLPGLQTDQKKNIPFNGELEGRARIITKDYSILDRVFLKIMKSRG